MKIGPPRSQSAPSPVRALKRYPGSVSLTEAEWGLIKPILCPSGSSGDRRNVDHRRSFEGILWVASNRLPWADLPEIYGHAGSVRRYYARLRERGTIERLLAAFPKSTSKNDEKAKAGVTAHAMLACLRDLEQRRPRGAATRKPR